MKVLFVLLAFFGAETAHADFAISCGEGRKKGPAKSEIGIAETVDSMATLHLDGETLSHEEFALVGRSHEWIVTVFPRDGAGTRKLVFREKSAMVHEYEINDETEEETQVRMLPCVWKEGS